MKRDEGCLELAREGGGFSWARKTRVKEDCGCVGGKKQEGEGLLFYSWVLGKEARGWWFLVRQKEKI